MSVRRHHPTLRAKRADDDGEDDPLDITNTNNDNSNDDDDDDNEHDDDDAARNTTRGRSRREACVRLAGGAAFAALGGPLLLASPPPSFATPEDIAEAYDRYAATYDDLDGGAFAADTLGLDALRKSALARASGEVLELGVGTGLNLPGYDLSKVASLTAVDISNGMLTLARSRADDMGLRVLTEAEWAAAARAESEAMALTMALAGSSDGAATPPPPSPPAKRKDPPSPPVRFMLADAETLPFPDASFDCVVDTFSLCVMENPRVALAEVRRVLRPGGRALLVEHSKSTFAPLLGAYQDLTAPAVRALAKGCAWNQDVVGLAEAAGLTVVTAEPSLLGLLTTLEATP